MKNSDLLNSIPAWNELLGVKFRAVESFELLKYFNAEVKPNVSAAEKANLGLFEKYGEAMADGTMSVSPDKAPAKFKAFAKERQEFLEAESVVKPYARALQDVLKGAKDADLSMATLMQLEGFFSDGEPKKKPATRKRARS